MKEVEVFGMMVPEEQVEQAIAEAKAEYTANPEDHESLKDIIEIYLSELAYSDD